MQPQVFKEDYTIKEYFWDIERIRDWGIRIQSYTDEQKAFYNDMVPKIQELKGIAKSTQKWDLIVESKSDQIKIESKRSIRGLQMMRANGPIDWSPIEIRRCMGCKEFLREWDLNCDENSTLKVVGANAMIKYKKSVKKFVIAPREFVVN